MADRLKGKVELITGDGTEIAESLVVILRARAPRELFLEERWQRLQRWQEYGRRRR